MSKHVYINYVEGETWNRAPFGRFKHIAYSMIEDVFYVIDVDSFLDLQQIFLRPENIEASL